MPFPSVEETVDALQFLTGVDSRNTTWQVDVDTAGRVSQILWHLPGRKPTEDDIAALLQDADFQAYRAARDTQEKRQQVALRERAAALIDTNDPVVMAAAAMAAAAASAVDTSDQRKLGAEAKRRVIAGNHDRPSDPQAVTR